MLQGISFPSTLEMEPTADEMPLMQILWTSPAQRYQKCTMRRFWAPVRQPEGQILSEQRSSLEGFVMHCMAKSYMAGASKSPSGRAELQDPNKSFRSIWHISCYWKVSFLLGGELWHLFTCERNETNHRVSFTNELRLHTTQWVEHVEKNISCSTAPPTAAVYHEAVKA